MNWWICGFVFLMSWTGCSSLLTLKQKSKISGELGDCWLLAAMASLAMRRDLLDQVIVPNQDFESNYNGKFYFKFWVPHIDPKSSNFEILYLIKTREIVKIAQNSKNI